LKVICTPTAKSNPYQFILADVLKTFGVKFEFQFAFPSIRQLLKRRKQVRILHLHWISNFYRGRRPYLRLLKFASQILTAKILGYRIIWTAHNIMPHQRTHTVIDMAGRILITRVADAIISHCDYAKTQIANRYRRKKRVYVIAHGSYIGMYDNLATRREARKKLHIDENTFVFLCFGKLLAYKRVDYLIETFIRLGDERAILLIAGQGTEKEIQRLNEIRNGDDRIRLDIGFIPDNEVQYYFNAADVLVTPFSEILTSGSILLSLSFGLPVIAPDQGCLTELIGSNKGILYPRDDPQGLLNAMQSIQRSNRKKMAQAAYSCAETLDWQKIGRATFDLYSEL